MIGDLADRMLCRLHNAVGKIEPRLGHRKEARFLGEGGAALGEINAGSREAPELCVLAFGTQGLKSPIRIKLAHAH
jgi:hypothetical protein